MSNLRHRSPNIDGTLIDSALDTINSWNHSKLTWDQLLSEIETKTGHKYTRQALSNQPSIKKCFNDKKNHLDILQRPRKKQ